MLTMSAALAALMITAAIPASAQVTGDSALVVVNVSNVANNLAQNLKVDVSQIPVTVQAPIDVAAAVCGVDVSVLTSNATGGSSKCDAKSTNSALNDIVQQQIKK